MDARLNGKHLRKQLQELVSRSHQLRALKLASEFNLLSFPEVMEAGRLTLPKKLQHLDVRFQRDAVDLCALSSCLALQRLDLDWCREVEDLSALGSCTAMQLLILSCCSKVE